MLNFIWGNAHEKAIFSAESKVIKCIGLALQYFTIAPAISPVFATNKNVKSELITIWRLVFSRAWSDSCLLQIFIGLWCYFLSSHLPIWLRLVCRCKIKCERLIF